jgi:hypothetical protein
MSKAYREANAIIREKKQKIMALGSPFSFFSHPSFPNMLAGDS